MKKPKNIRGSMPGNSPRALEPFLEQAAILVKEGSTTKARLILYQVLRSTPGDRMAHLLLNHAALMDGDLGGLRRAVELQRTLPIPPDIVAWNLSHLNLRLGVMPQGWDEYEVRCRIPGLVIPERHFSQPRWNGEPFPGKTLLLHYEQGFGDTLMFVRYARRAKALGGLVLLDAQVPLADLVATCPGVDEVVPEGSPIPPFDLQLPLLSLPRIFQTDLASIPAEVPYLSVPQRVPNRVGIQDLLARSNGRVKIGLSWAGSAIHTRDAQRSIAPGALSPLNALREVAWHGFQLGATEIPPLHGMTSLAPILSNFSDTAFALSGMDLLITVDTAMAHLAGALGIPTLLLVSYIPDWRWMMGRADSPWYPTLRIYRQPKPNDWGTVIRQVVEDLSGEGVGPEPGPGDQVPDNGADQP